MTDINLITYDTVTTHNCTNSASSYTFDAGAVYDNEGASPSRNSFDGNFSTVQGIGWSGQTDNQSYGEIASVTSMHTFVRPLTISKFVFSMYAYADDSGSYTRGRRCYGNVQYLSGGVWTNIWSTDTGEQGGNGSVSFDTGTQTYTGPYTGVTAVQANCVTYSYKNGGSGSAQGYAYIREMQAWGQPFIDIGLRYKGNSKISVGVEPLRSTHALRLRYASTTYGIPLLSTSDILASDLRIYNNGSTYAVPNIT